MPFSRKLNFFAEREHFVVIVPDSIRKKETKCLLGITAIILYIYKSHPLNMKKVFYFSLIESFLLFFHFGDIVR